MTSGDLPARSRLRSRGSGVVLVAAREHPDTRDTQLADLLDQPQEGADVSP